MVVVVLLIQFCIYGYTYDLWTLYFAVQYICYMQVYDVPMPANASLFINWLTRTVEFEIFNPVTYVRLVSAPEPHEVFLTHKDQAYSIVTNWFFFTLSGCFMPWLLLMGYVA